jgi:Zn finger protein HypA/HybF involved in hydrogenase expression
VKPDYVLSPLDVLRASKLAGADHHITAITAAGAACDRCNRLLSVVQWAAPCPEAKDAP